MVIDVVGLKNHASELLQQVVLFVRGAVRPDDADARAAVLICTLAQPFSRELQRIFPRGGNQAPVLANQRLLEPVFMVGEIEGVTALDAQEVSVDTALVAIVATDNLHAGIGAANAQGGFASIAAVRAGRPNVVHLPRTRLVAIRT